MNCLAAAPTGIAAANIEIEGTDICAATLHSVFDLDGKYESKLDFTKPGLDKVAAIMKMKAVAFVCSPMECFTKETGNATKSMGAGNFGRLIVNA